jgi:hypothetical protein
MKSRWLVRVTHTRASWGELPREILSTLWAHLDMRNEIVWLARTIAFKPASPRAERFGASWQCEVAVRPHIPLGRNHPSCDHTALRGRSCHSSRPSVARARTRCAPLCIRQGDQGSGSRAREHNARYWAASTTLHLQQFMSESSSGDGVREHQL